MIFKISIMIFCFEFKVYSYIKLILYNDLKILILQLKNLKYNRIDMKKRTSQKILRPNRKIASSVKQLPLSSAESDSLKAPRKKQARKNRNFGDDITNLQKQPVFQQEQAEKKESLQNQTSFRISQIQPYLSQIGSHIRGLDDQYNMQVLSKLSTKSSDSTEVTLQMRKILIKWILQVAQKFRACRETIHISVQIIDYILVFSHKKITKANFQLLGISALFVASKYNEIYTPEAKKYIYVCDGLYTLENLFQMQSYILTLTKFNLQFPTLNNFIGPLINDSDLGENFQKTVENFSNLIVMDFNLFNRYKKLHLSGVIAFFSAKLTNVDRFSPFEIMQTMKIDEQTFKNCFTSLVSLYKQYIKPSLLNPQNKDE